MSEFSYVANVSLVAGTEKTFRVAITKPNIAREFISKAYKNFIFPFGHPKKTSIAYNFISFNYDIETIGDDKFFIILPTFVTALSVNSWIWLESMYNAEESYRSLMRLGWKPEQARSVLPNSLKTEIVVTTNLREWREIFEQRTAKTAHPQMRELMIPLECKLQELIPVVFDKIQ